jgi:hypothetical protein
VQWRKKLTGMTDGDRKIAEMMASGKVDTMSGDEMEMSCMAKIQLSVGGALFRLGWRGTGRQ